MMFSSGIFLLKGKGMKVFLDEIKQGVHHSFVLGCSDCCTGVGSYMENQKRNGMEQCRAFTCNNTLCGRAHVVVVGAVLLPCKYNTG